MMKNPYRFDYKYFESLPEPNRLEEANKHIKSLFPDGSTILSFERYFSDGGAKCFRDTSKKGAAMICTYQMPGLSLVSTEWVAVAYIDETGERIQDAFVNRYLTGL